MKTTVLFITMAALLNWFSCLKKPVNQKIFQDDKFIAGQIWKYNTRPGEEKSTLTILKVEKYDKAGIVVHVYVSGLKQKNTRVPGGYSDEIGHLPFSKDALLKSVTTLVSSGNKLPDYKGGYDVWKEAFDNNKAGVFSITVSQAVQFVEQAMNNQ
jgi:hypothetical protein